jgi:DNA ligase (NAD+)
LQRGDSILVERANDVIPRVAENISKRDKYEIDFTLIPERCPSCGFPLETKGVHLYCSNIDCVEQQIQKIVFWIKNVEADGVSEGLIRKFYDANLIRTIKDLYSITKQDLLKLEGLGEASASKIIHAIELSKKMSFPKMISRLGIPLVGEKALAKLGIKDIDSFLALKESNMVIGKNIISWKSEENNLSLVYELLDVLTILAERADARNDLVCMTGAGPRPRKELLKEIEEQGYTFSDSITRNTKFLICEDPNGQSSKLVKARKLGVKLVSYEEFFK